MPCLLLFVYLILFNLAMFRRFGFPIRLCYFGEVWLFAVLLREFGGFAFIYLMICCMFAFGCLLFLAVI